MRRADEPKRRQPRDTTCLGLTDQQPFRAQRACRPSLRSAESRLRDLAHKSPVRSDLVPSDILRSAQRGAHLRPCPAVHPSKRRACHLLRSTGHSAGSRHHRPAGARLLIPIRRRRQSVGPDLCVSLWLDPFLYRWPPAVCGPFGGKSAGVFRFALFQGQVQCVLWRKFRQPVGPFHKTYGSVKCL